MFIDKNDRRRETWRLQDATLDMGRKLGLDRDPMEFDRILKMPFECFQHIINWMVDEGNPNRNRSTPFKRFQMWYKGARASSGTVSTVVGCGVLYLFSEASEMIICKLLGVEPNTPMQTWLLKKPASLALPAPVMSCFSIDMQLSTRFNNRIMRWLNYHSCIINSGSIFKNLQQQHFCDSGIPSSSSLSISSIIANHSFTSSVTDRHAFQKRPTNRLKSSTFSRFCRDSSPWWSFHNF